MASKVLIYVSLIVGSISLSQSLDWKSSSHRILRSIELENEGELKAVVDDVLSPENVRQFVRNLLKDSFLEKLRNQRLSDEELAQIVVRQLAITNADALEKVQSLLLDSETTLEDIVQTINEKLQVEALTLVDGRIRINFRAIVERVLEILQKVIDQYVNQPSIRSVLKENLSSLLRRHPLEDLEVSESLIRSSLSIARYTGRERRSLRHGGPGGHGDSTEEKFSFLNFFLTIIIKGIRAELIVYIKPIHIYFDTVVIDIQNTILLYYVAEEPTGAISKLVTHILNSIIINVVEVVSICQTEVDKIFVLIIGDDPCSKTKRSVDVFASNSASTNGTTEISTGKTDASTLVTVVVRSLNLVLKNVTEKVVKSAAPPVGLVVLQPVGVLLNYLINLLLPCSNCRALILA